MEKLNQVKGFPGSGKIISSNRIITPYP